MKWITLTIGQRDWKFMLDYGFKWYTNLDLEKLPNIFNIRDFVKNNLIKESPYEKTKRILASIFSKLQIFKNKNTEFENIWEYKRELENQREYRSIKNNPLNTNPQNNDSQDNTPLKTY